MTPTNETDTPEVYRRLGLVGCINASGHVTAMGGSRMPKEVTEAMADAAGAFIPLSELHAAAGRRIAELTGAESALVTSGAAGAIVLAAAACIAGTDEESIRRLPDSSGLAKRILVPPTPGLTWVHYTRLAGGCVKVCESVDELAQLAGDENTAMLIYLPSIHNEGPLKLEDFLKCASVAKKPLMVDAADKLPPHKSLRHYNDLGVDLVGISGGKGLRGPQCTGILMGRSDLISAAYKNACAPGIGRPMKVGKEEIVGIVTALELYLERDHEAEMSRWQEQLQHIEQVLGSGMQLERFNEMRIAEGPRLRIHIPSDRNAQEVRKALSEGTPRIMVGQREGVLVVDPQTLQPGEERAVAQGLRRVLLGDTQ
jgi:D-glucosaminate-6-phosphate ammonia-lyase